MEKDLKIKYWLAGLLLCVYFTQAASIALKKTNTWDEPAHILSGYAYVTGGMDYLSPLNHPVFGRMLTGILPALFLDLEFDKNVKPEEAEGSDFFPYSVKFLYGNNASAEDILFLSRLPNILLGVLLGAYIFIWSKELWGINGALLSLFFYSLSPNILAHSSLATTDMPITVFFFISVYYLYKLSRDGFTSGRIVLAAFFIALAVTSKHTALLLMPLILAALVMSLRKEPGLKTVSKYLLLSCAIFFFIWLTYGFRYHSGDPLYSPLHWEKFSASALMPLFDFYRAVKILPESYLYGVLGSLAGAGAGKPAFLMGEYSVTGWWYYFIVAFLIKTPLPAIILLSASLLYVSREREGLKKALYLTVPAAVIFIVFSVQKVNIGLRHVLPAYPFLFALLGFVPNIKTPSMKAAKAVFYACLVWYAYSAASIFPHNLAYFNELAGGPGNGYKYLVDSNLDWGQDLKGLKEYMDKNKIEKIKLSYFGLSDPSYFGIDYEYLPSFVIVNPKELKADVPIEGWFAVSATMLQGVYMEDRDYFAYFRDKEPAAKIGYSIFVYRF